MASLGCTHYDGSRAEGVGAGGTEWTAVAVGVEVCTGGTRRERERHWVKETFDNLKREEWRFLCLGKHVCIHNHTRGDGVLQAWPLIPFAPFMRVPQVQYCPGAIDVT